jgi:hypothetical protein
MGAVPGALCRAAIILCALLAGVEARAQSPPLRANARVRVSLGTLDEARVVSGTLLLYSRDSVTILPRHEATARSFPLADVVRFEVNRGRPAVLEYGAPLYGALLGAWFGATALAPDPACAAGATDPDCHWETSSTIVGAAGGAVLFGVAVRLMPEVWQDVPLTAFALGPGGPQVRIGLSLRMP